MDSWKKYASWVTTPAVADRTVGASCRTSIPSMRIALRDTSYNRATSAHSVDLPAPDGPTRAVIVPGRIMKLTSRNAHSLALGTPPSMSTG